MRRHQTGQRRDLAVTIFVIATVLVGSVLTALAEPKSVTVKNFPDDAPCEVFRRDEKGSWHLRDGIVIVTGSLGGVTGDLKVSKWTRTAATADGKRLEKRCGAEVK
jgi:hypothetical protein